MSLEMIVVIGAGQMGSGIAQVCAQSGLNVLMQDTSEEALERGLQAIEKSLNRFVEKKSMLEGDKEATLQRLTTTTDINDAHDADLVIEAVIENMEVKKEIFQQLDVITSPETILATNTSSLPITEIAAATSRPEKVIGMHYMNPVPVMKLEEIIRAIQTEDDTYEKVVQVAKQLYKTTVTVHDYPCFFSNRILMPMINEAIYTVYEGVASPEDVDTVMKLGMNHPMGPLRLADF